jgi:hypothetical protein
MIPTTVGELARRATAWLLEVGKRRRERGWGVVRAQRWVERVHKDVSCGPCCVRTERDVLADIDS